MKGSAYDDVTIAQLLTMTSGIKWNEDYEDPKSDVARFNEHKAEPGIDVTVSYMRKLPREAPAGTKWVYKTGETNLIGVLVSKATGKKLSDYLSKKSGHRSAWNRMAAGCWDRPAMKSAAAASRPRPATMPASGCSSSVAAWSAARRSCPTAG
jgi:CubicO group peptidase (beta-lactamase class C family)